MAAAASTMRAVATVRPVVAKRAPAARPAAPARGLAASRSSSVSVRSSRGLAAVGAVVACVAVHEENVDAPASAHEESYEGVGGGDQNADAPPTPSNRLYVGNLPYEMDGESLRAAFAEYGAVENADVVTDPRTGRSKGYAFVTLSSTEEAERVLGQLDGASRDDRRGGERRMGGGDRGSYSRPAPGAKLFVGNLAWSMDDEAIADLFSEYGKVAQARVVTDETGRSKGFGFVTYESAEQADKAIEQLDGQSVEGRVIRVSVAASKR
eukprot:jgi/Chlat1/3314/Chrsp22S03472